MSVNKAILVGRTGKDVELRYMTNGKPVANVTLATTRHYKDGSGERKQSTEWHNLVFFDRLAEIAGEHLKKGSQIYAEGRIETRKWQDKEGKDRFTTEIKVDEMKMLGKKSGSDSASPSQESSGSPQSTLGTTGDPRNWDDDIPFE